MRYQTSVSQKTLRDSRFDTRGLEDIDLCFLMPLFKMFVEVRARAQTTDKYDALSRISCWICPDLTRFTVTDRFLFFT